MTPSLNELSNTLGVILVGFALEEIVVSGQGWWGLTILTLGLLLMLPYWWLTIRNALRPLTLPSVFQCVRFLVIAALLNIGFAAVHPFRVRASLEVEGQQLSHDLADFNSAKDKAEEDITRSSPWPPNWEQLQNGVEQRYEEKFRELYTARINKFCNELDGLGFDFNYQFQNGYTMKTICVMSSRSGLGAISWNFGQFQAIAGQVSIISPIFYGAVKYLSFTLVSFVIWFISVVIRNRTLEVTKVGKKITDPSGVPLTTCVYCGAPRWRYALRQDLCEKCGRFQPREAKPT